MFAECYCEENDILNVAGPLKNVAVAGGKTALGECNMTVCMAHVTYVCRSIF